MSLELVQVEAEVKTKLVELAGERYPEINVDGVAASLVTRFRLSPEIASDLDSWHRTEKDGQRFTLRWGAHLLASGINAHDRIQAITTWHTGLMANLESMTQDLIGRYRDLLLRGDSVAMGLDEEVERLSLQRILPGRCFVCPDAAPGRPTRSRKT